MKITADVRKHAANKAISQEEALPKGMEEKSKEFADKRQRALHEGVKHEYLASLPTQKKLFAAANYVLAKSRANMDMAVELKKSAFACSGRNSRYACHHNSKIRTQAT